MINAPPPPNWGSARFSYESASAAADRLSQDLGRMSFEAAAGRYGATPRRGGGCAVGRQAALLPGNA